MSSTYATCDIEAPPIAALDTAFPIIRETNSFRRETNLLSKLKPKQAIQSLVTVFSVVVMWALLS